MKYDRRDRRAPLAVDHHPRAGVQREAQVDHFRLIVPCGIAESGVTSLATELGEGACPTVAATINRIAGHFAEVFGAAVTG